jgi:hypothetical protein
MLSENISVELISGAAVEPRIGALARQSRIPFRVEHIGEHPINKLEELLPWNVAIRLPSLRLAA